MQSHLESFLPENITEYSNIEISVSIDTLDLADYFPIRIKNEVNNHRFKPRFYEHKSTNKLIIHAQSLDIAIQTRAAVIDYLCAIGKDNTLGININMYNTEVEIGIEEAFKTFTPNPTVIVGNIPTVLDSLFIHAISNLFGNQKAESFMLQVNLSRIDKDKKQRIETSPRSHLDLIYSILKSTFTEIEVNNLVSQLSIKQIQNKGALQVLDVKYQNNFITIIQRPWGKQLSVAIARELNKSNRVSSLYFTGGCAGLHDRMNVDDIVLAKACAYEDEPNVNHSNIKQISSSINSFLDVGIDSRRIHLGDFYTVKSSLKNEGLLNKLYEANIGAIEMELAYFLKEIPNADVFPAFYVMDLPLKGTTLSDTYYNFDFLAGLAAKKDRAKNIIHHAIINDILHPSMQQ